MSQSRYEFYHYIICAWAWTLIIPILFQMSSEIINCFSLQEHIDLQMAVINHANFNYLKEHGKGVEE